MLAARYARPFHRPSSPRPATLPHPAALHCRRCPTSAGFVVPTVVIAVWECRSFQEFRAARRGQLRSGGSGGGGWELLYARSTPGVLAGRASWDWLEASKIGLVSLSLFGAVWGCLRLYAERRAF